MPAFRMQYGFNTKSMIKANPNAVRLSYCFRLIWAPQTAICITPARTTEAENPVIAINSKVTGMQTQAESLPLPSKTYRNITKKERCMPETATQCATPEERSMVENQISCLSLLLSPVSTAKRKAALLRSNILLIRCRRKAPILAGIKRQ